MFKVRDRVVYKGENSSLLTKNKIYEILEIYNGLIKVLNDKGETAWVNEFRFKLAEESTPVTKFQVGDIVEYAGLRGEVTSTNYHSKCPVVVNLGNVNRAEYFTADGKLHVWHEKPLLKLIERPKKKEKRQISLNTYYSPSLDLTFPVDTMTLPGDAQLVVVSAEVEVEV